MLGPLVLLAAVMSFGISTMPAGAQSSSCGNAVIEGAEDCDPPGSSCDGGGTCENDCTCPTPTTTTLPGCVPANCDDNDPCTADTCGASGCEHAFDESLTGLDRLTCQVKAIGGTLDTAPDDQLGGSRLAGKLDAKFDKIEAKINSALGAEGAAQERRLKKARKLLKQFVKQVQKGIDSGKIDPAVGQELIELANDASAAAQT